MTVNGEPISDALINEEFHAIKAHYERMGRHSCCERDDEFRGYARENIIARVLVNQEAERRFPEVSEEAVTTALERIIEEQGGRAAFFAHAGLTPAQEPLVREDVRSGLRVDRLMEETWSALPAPDATRQQSWYEENIHQFLSPEEISAVHLFKQVEKVEDREPTYDLLRRLRAEARSGADFTALALTHTDKEDKMVDLGWFKRGEFMEEFDLIIFSLDEGEMSPVFASHWGFHLAKVTGRRAPAPRPFTEVQEEVRAQMLAEARQTATQALVAALKARAIIEAPENSA
jgi:peptidyl-prolyl cis-trans isomerase C